MKYRRSILTVTLLTVVIAVTAVAYNAVAQYRRQGVLINYTEPAQDTVDETLPLNINTATAVELTKLEGIGNTKAAAIISYREANGEFKTVEELLNVEGIGEKMLENIRESVCV